MKEVQVSVIVPVYNAEKYLAKCLESLVNQTLEEIEVICVDDGSTDGSFCILQEYQSRDSRIRVFSNPHNMGESAARNRGMKEAVGKYIQFVDADDYIEKEDTQELWELAETNNADMCYLGMQVHIEDGLVEKAVASSISGEYPGVFDGKELLRRLTENNEFFYYACSVFYKSSFLKEHKLQYRKLICGQGGNFIPRCLCHAKRVIVCNKKYYHYRVHGESVTHTENVQKELLMGKIMRYVDLLQYFAEDESSVELEIFLNETYRKLMGGIQGLTSEVKDELQERMPSNFARHVFRVLCGEGKNYRINLTDDILMRIKKKDAVIIYGAGYASKDVIEIMQQNSIEILGFTVTKRKNGENCLFGHHIYEIQELVQYKDSAAILVAANKKYNKEIEEILKEHGFKDYYFLNIEI